MRTAAAIRIGAALRDACSKARTSTIREITKAADCAGGNLIDTAKRLDVSHRSLVRWISEHADLDAEIRAIRERYGVRHEFGSEGRSQKHRARQAS